MALVLRMARGGRRNLPFYRIVVADKRYPRDGRFIEKVGTYDPRLPSNDEKRVVLNKERIEHWIKMGAKPSDRIARMLADAGMGEKPEWRESPKKSAPKAKTVERMKEKEEKAKAAAEAAEAAAASPPPAEEPAAEAPAEAAAEEPKAE